MGKSVHSHPPEKNRQVWPSQQYFQEVEKLKNAIGQKIYLVEFKQSDIKLGVHYSGACRELLSVLDFPRPEPMKGIAPHMIVLDDGRGINLGRIGRVTVNKPFNPAPSDIVYQDLALMDAYLLQERQLNDQLIADCSSALLDTVLNRSVRNKAISRSGGN